MTTTTPQSGYTGICVSPGIGIGRAFVYRKGTPAITRRRVAGHQVAAEVERFRNTLHQAGDEIRRIRRIVASEQGEELAQIFDAQLAMLQDPGIKEKTEALIGDKLYSAERAYAQTLAELKASFGNIENAYLRERVHDIDDIENQVLMRLAGAEVQALHALRANTIVIAHDLLPSEMVRLERRQVKGVVLDIGGATSHAAIIARSLRLPTVTAMRLGSTSGSSARKSSVPVSTALRTHSGAYPRSACVSGCRQRAAPPAYCAPRKSPRNCFAASVASWSM